MPAIELKLAASIAVTRETAEVTDADVDAQVLRIAESNRSYETKDGAAESGDRVTIYYLGKVVGAMLAKGFLQKVDAETRKGEPVWRETGDGHGVTLVATDAGLVAIGIEPEDANTAPAGATDAQTEAPVQNAPHRTRSLAQDAHTARGHQAGLCWCHPVCKEHREPLCM